MGDVWETNKGKKPKKTDLISPVFWFCKPEGHQTLAKPVCFYDSTALKSLQMNFFVCSSLNITSFLRVLFIFMPTCILQLSIIIYYFTIDH